ncbi:hypothetical protein DL765_008768 [Monosporascus sp. GIB2]|nr:hypothetical protein DL765_008768 [Monosporascus sp. GIB2]
MDIEVTEDESQCMDGSTGPLHWGPSVDNKQSVSPDLLGLGDITFLYPPQNYMAGAVEGLTFESALVNDDPGANAAAIQPSPGSAAVTDSEIVHNYERYALEHPQGLLSSAIPSRKSTPPHTWPDEPSIYGQGNDTGWNVTSSGPGIATPNSTAFDSFPGFSIEGVSDHLVGPYNSVSHPSPGALASPHTSIPGHHPSGLHLVEESLEEDSIDGLSSRRGTEALPNKSQKFRDGSWEVTLNNPSDQHPRRIGDCNEILLPKKDPRRHQEQSRRVEPSQWKCKERRCASFGKTYNRLDNYNRHIKKVHAKFADGFTIPRYYPWKPAPSTSNTSL